MPKLLDTRIARLERALGIDPQSQCLGDPELCGDICTVELCPSTQNAFFRLLDTMSQMQGQVSLLRTSIEELASMAGVTDMKQFRARIELRSQLRELHKDRVQMTHDLEHLSKLSNNPVLLERAKQTLAATEAEISGVQVALEMLG